MDDDQDEAYQPPPSAIPEDRRGWVTDEGADAQAGIPIQEPVPNFLGFNVRVGRVYPTNFHLSFRNWRTSFGRN